MRKEAIGPIQLFSMMVLFELGTAIVVPIGLESGHAVWLSILMALPGGFSYIGFTSICIFNFPI